MAALGPPIKTRPNADLSLTTGRAAAVTLRLGFVPFALPFNESQPVRKRDPMSNPARQLSQSHDVSGKVAQILQTRTRLALERFSERVHRAYERQVAGLMATADLPVGALGQRRTIRRGLRAALGPLVGHAAPARQQLHRTRTAGIAAGPALRPRDGHGRALARASGQLRAAAHHSAAGRDGGREAPPVRDHRPARRPRPGYRRLQGRFPGRGSAARRPSGVLRHLLPESRTGTDAARCLQRRARVRAPRARIAPRGPQARDHRQLPGRLVGDDARRRQSRRYRPARDRRRADVVLGRRLARGRGRQSDALRRRAARRHLARLAHLRSRRGDVRRRLAGAELRVPEPRQHVLGQVLPGVRQHRRPRRSASSSSSAGGAATTC